MFTQPLDMKGPALERCTALSYRLQEIACMFTNERERKKVTKLSNAIIMIFCVTDQAGLFISWWRLRRAVRSPSPKMQRRDDPAVECDLADVSS